MTRAAGGPAQWLDLNHQPTAAEEAIARGFEGTTLPTDRVVQPFQGFAAVVAVRR